MKKNSSGKRGAQEVAPSLSQPEKSGWIRKFCGKGFFREIWKNRFVILKQDQLFICEREVKELGRADEVLDLMDYEHCEEVRKNKSRSKKNHSKFRLLRSTAPGLTVTVEDGTLSHLTRDRARIPHTRRLPTRGHLLAVASASSDGALTLDLIQEEDLCPRSRTDTALSTRTSAAEASGKSHTLPRQVAQSGKAVASSEKSVSLEQIHKSHDGAGESPSHRSESDSVKRLQELIAAKLQQTEQLLTELGQNQDQDRSRDEAQRLLTEARHQWNQAHEVLSQVQQLKDLYQRLDSNGTVTEHS